MAKAPVNVDNLLGNLLGNLDKGIMSSKKTKVKKSPKIQDVNKATYRLHKPTLESVKIVLLVHVNTCLCCGESTGAANKHVLVEKRDKWSNMHRTRFLTQEDIEKCPRVVEYVEHDVPACVVCFEKGCELEPVLTEDAKKMEAVDIDSVIDNMFKGEK